MKVLYIECQSWPWPLNPWPKINRVPPLIIHNLHVKFESDWTNTVVAIVSTRESVTDTRTHPLTHSPNHPWTAALLYPLQRDIIIRTADYNSTLTSLVSLWQFFHDCAMELNVLLAWSNFPPCKFRNIVVNGSYKYKVLVIERNSSYKIYKNSERIISNYQSVREQNFLSHSNFDKIVQ